QKSGPAIPRQRPDAVHADHERQQRAESETCPKAHASAHDEGRAGGTTNVPGERRQCGTHQKERDSGRAADGRWGSKRGRALAVQQYRRPVWTFNKILYCEKEGFFPILKDASWPERHDCALLTSKGFSSRAVRDVLDLLGATEEPLTFYCIHDADGPGTLIYQ